MLSYSLPSCKSPWHNKQPSWTDVNMTSRTPIDNIMHKFDVSSSCWSRVEAKGNRPSPRVGHTAARVGASIYIFGGRSGETASDVTVLCNALQKALNICSTLLTVCQGTNVMSKVG